MGDQIDHAWHTVGVCAGSESLVPLPWVLTGLWKPESGLPRAQPRDFRNGEFHPSKKLLEALRNKNSFLLLAASLSSS